MADIPKLKRWTTRDLAYVNYQGKRYYFGKWGSEESYAKYNEFIDSLKITSKEVITLKKVVESFLAAKANYYVKRGSQTRQLSRIRTACEYPVKMYGDLDVNAVTPKKLLDCREEMVRSNRFSRAYINTLISCFRLVIRWGVEQELVNPNALLALQAISPLKAGRSTARESQPIKSVDPTIVEETLNLVPQVIADMARVQMLTGMRPIEVCQMREGDIDFGSKPIAIYTLATDKTDYRRNPKDKRKIPLGRKAVDIIKRYVNGDPNNVIFSPRKSNNVKGRCNETYDSASYGRAIARACKKAKIDKWSPNQLRHLFATRVRQEYGLEAAQVCLGHSRADVTQIYAERDFQKAVEVAIKQG